MAKGKGAGGGRSAGGGAGAAAGGATANSQEGFNAFLQDGGLDAVIAKRGDDLVYIWDVKDAFKERQPNATEVQLNNYLIKAQQQGRIQLVSDDLSGTPRDLINRGIRLAPGGNVRVHVLKRDVSGKSDPDLKPTRTPAQISAAAARNLAAQQRQSSRIGLSAAARRRQEESLADIADLF